MALWVMCYIRLRTSAFVIQPSQCPLKPSVHPSWCKSLDIAGLKLGHFCWRRSGPLLGSGHLASRAFWACSSVVPCLQLSQNLKVQGRVKFFSKGLCCSKSLCQVKGSGPALEAQVCTRSKKVLFENLCRTFFAGQASPVSCRCTLQQLPQGHLSS